MAASPATGLEAEALWAVLPLPQGARLGTERFHAGAVPAFLEHRVSRGSPALRRGLGLGTGWKQGRETTGTSELKEDTQQHLRVSEHIGGDRSCLLFLPSSLRVAQNHEALWGRDSQRGDSCSVCPGHFSLGLNWHKCPIALSSLSPTPF